MSVRIAEFNKTVEEGNLEDAQTLLKSLIQEKLGENEGSRSSLYHSPGVVLKGVYSLTLAKYFEPLKYKLAWMVVDECVKKELAEES